MMYHKAVSNAVLVIFASFALALFPLAVMAHGEEGSKSDKHEHPEEGSKYLYGNHVCPISGEPVVASSFIEYYDPESHVYGRIYLCCDDCIPAASKDSAKLYKNLYRTDKKTGKPKEARDLKNEKCPISEGDNRKITEYNGLNIGFCCYNCPNSFMKDPEKYMAKLLPDAKEFMLEKEAGSSRDDDHDHDHDK